MNAVPDTLLVAREFDLAFSKVLGLRFRSSGMLVYWDCGVDGTVLLSYAGTFISLRKSACRGDDTSRRSKGTALRC